MKEGRNYERIIKKLLCPGQGRNDGQTEILFACLEFEDIRNMDIYQNEIIFQKYFGDDNTLFLHIPDVMKTKKLEFFFLRGDCPTIPFHSLITVPSKCNFQAVAQ